MTNKTIEAENKLAARQYNWSTDMPIQVGLMYTTGQASYALLHLLPIKDSFTRDAIYSLISGLVAAYIGLNTYTHYLKPKIIGEARKFLENLPKNNPHGQ